MSSQSPQPSRLTTTRPDGIDLTGPGSLAAWSRRDQSESLRGGRGLRSSLYLGRDELDRTGRDLAYGRHLVTIDDRGERRRRTHAGRALLNGRVRLARLDEYGDGRDTIGEDQVRDGSARTWHGLGGARRHAETGRQTHGVP